MRGTAATRKAVFLALRGCLPRPGGTLSRNRPKWPHRAAGNGRAGVSAGRPRPRPLRAACPTVGEVGTIAPTAQKVRPARRPTPEGTAPMVPERPNNPARSASHRAVTTVPATPTGALSMEKGTLRASMRTPAKAWATPIASSAAARQYHGEGCSSKKIPSARTAAESMRTQSMAGRSTTPALFAAKAMEPMITRPVRSYRDPGAMRSSTRRPRSTAMTVSTKEASSDQENALVQGLIIVSHDSAQGECAKDRPLESARQPPAPRELGRRPHRVVFSFGREGVGSARREQCWCRLFCVASRGGPGVQQSTGRCGSPRRYATVRVSRPIHRQSRGLRFAGTRDMHGKRTIAMVAQDRPAR